MTQFTGELISLGVAFSWTLTALACDVASRYASSLVMNVVRMSIALPLFLILLWVTTGSPIPLYADSGAWLWLSLAGLVGYVFGDLCLFSSYKQMGSRYGQLFMTLAPVFAAIGGRFMLDETLSLRTYAIMSIVLLGIAISVCGRGEKGESSRGLKVPVMGVVYGIGAAIGQGIGLVMSKIGMLSYAAALPDGISEQSVMMPFAATFIRCLIAFVLFTLILIARRETAAVPKFIKNGKAISSMVIATIFGPLIGVSLSLLAVQYTSTAIASTLMALVPIFILFPSWKFMHQRITILDIIGTFIAVGGVAALFI